jgi:hypothetical protein
MSLYPSVSSSLSYVSSYFQQLSTEASIKKHMVLNWAHLFSHFRKYHFYHFCNSTNLKPLNAKMNWGIFFYIKVQVVPHSKHIPPPLQTSIKVMLRHNRCLFWDPHETHKCNTRADCNIFFNVKPGSP